MSKRDSRYSLRRGGSKQRKHSSDFEYYMSKLNSTESAAEEMADDLDSDEEQEIVMDEEVEVDTELVEVVTPDVGQVVEIERIDFERPKSQGVEPKLKQPTNKRRGPGRPSLSKSHDLGYKDGVKPGTSMIRLTESSSSPQNFIECEECHKYLKPNSYRQHLRTHTGVRPFNCEACGARFTRKGDVDRHVRIVHYKERPFKCCRCQRAFGDKKNLRWHLLNHDKRLFYVCAVCGFKFGKKEYWENHVKFIHPEAALAEPTHDDESSDGQPVESEARSAIAMVAEAASQHSAMTRTTEEAVESIVAVSDEPEFVSVKEGLFKKVQTKLKPQEETVELEGPVIVLDESDIQLLPDYPNSGTTAQVVEVTSDCTPDKLMEIIQAKMTPEAKSGDAVQTLIEAVQELLDKSKTGQQGGRTVEKK